MEKLEAMVRYPPPTGVTSKTITNTCWFNTFNSSAFTVSGLYIRLETNTCEKPKQNGLYSDPARE